MNENNLKALPDGRYLAVDKEGISHICASIEEAMRYLWDENEGNLSEDKKYDKDVSPLPKKPKRGLAQIPPLNLNPVYFEWLSLLENGDGDAIDAFLEDFPDFASLNFFDIPSLELSDGDLNVISLEDLKKKTATWAEVKEKGLSLLMDFNAVYVKYMNTNHIGASVEGFHGKYDTFLLRKAHLTKDNEPSEGFWFCTCEWGQWCNSGHRPHDGPDSTGSVKIQNRFCSHAYACYLLLHNPWIAQAYINPETGAVLF